MSISFTVVWVETNHLIDKWDSRKFCVHREATNNVKC